MNPFFDEFIIDCKTKNMTPHSIETYKCNLKEFLTYNPQPLDVGTKELRTYLENLKSRGLAPSTLKGYFAAVSSFYDFLVFEKVIRDNPVIGFRERYVLRGKHHGETRQLISIEEMREVFRLAGNIQEKAIILVMAKTGIRRGELHDLKESDIDFKRKIINIPLKAKRSNTIVFMDDELESVLIKYMTWRQERAKSDWLWVSRKGGGRIHKDNYSKILADIGERLNIHIKSGALAERLTPHCFRHFFTTYLYRVGMAPQYIQFLRGDSLSKEAWQIYNHMDMEIIRAEYLRCIPKLLEGYIEFPKSSALPKPKPVKVKRKTLSHLPHCQPHYRPHYGEATLKVFSLLKETPGLRRFQIVRLLKMNPKTIKSNVWKNRKRGYLSKDEAGKLYLTLSGTAILEGILNSVSPDAKDLSHSQDRI